MSIQNKGKEETIKSRMGTETNIYLAKVIDTVGTKLTNYNDLIIS